MMYDEVPDVLEIAMRMQRVRHDFKRYVQDRERFETLQVKRIAELELQCEQLRARNKAVNLYAEHFLGEREKLRDICMLSIERAIEKGDEKIAAMALTLLQDLYGDQFINTIRGGV